MSEEERQAAPQTPLATLSGRLPALVQQADHSEMWGVELSADAVAAPVQVVLQKFLRANAGDAAAAERQLVEALRWRRAVKPRELVHDAFDRRKFGDLGYVTTHRDAAGRETVITWNIYGAVKDNKATFGDVKEYEPLLLFCILSARLVRLLILSLTLQVHKMARRSHGARH